MVQVASCQGIRQCRSGRADEGSASSGGTSVFEEADEVWWIATT